MPAISSEILTKKWDAIVIGSGLAGMMTAVTLANQGKKVLVLEQHIIPGGYATLFKRKGFTFEVSLHQTTSLAIGQQIYKLLDEVGVMNKIIPIPLNETMLVTTQLGDIAIDNNFFTNLKRLFPKEIEAIDELVKIIDKIYKELEIFKKITILPKGIYNFLARLFMPTIYKYHQKVLTQLIDELFTDQLLKKIIGIKCGYFGGSPNQLSAILYLIGFGSFLKEGIFYIKGTSQALSNAFVSRLKELGGEIILGEGVEKIIVEGNKAVGVKSKNYEFRAPVIISNASPKITLEKLLPGKDLCPDYIKSIEKLEPSCSAFVVYLGLDCPLAKLTKDSNNFHSRVFLDNKSWDEIYQDIREDKGVGFDGLTDYGFIDPSLAPAGKTAIAIIRIEYFKNWVNLSREEYLKKKAKVQEDILSAVETYIPGFRSHIEVLDAATPLTMQRYTSNDEGAFDGFLCNPQRVGLCKGGLSLKTPVKGLYLSSAWIESMSGGFYGCILYGYLVAKQIIIELKKKRFNF